MGRRKHWKLIIGGIGFKLAITHKSIIANNKRGQHWKCIWHFSKYLNKCKIKAWFITSGNWTCALRIKLNTWMTENVHHLQEIHHLGDSKLETAEVFWLVLLLLFEYRRWDGFTSSATSVIEVEVLKY